MSSCVFFCRRGVEPDRLDRATASIRTIGRGEDNVDADADALADLWGAVEADAEAHAGEEDDEVGGFGFGGALDAKVGPPTSRRHPLF